MTISIETDARVQPNALLNVVITSLAKHTRTEPERILPELLVAEVPGMESVRLLRVLSDLEDSCGVSVPDDYPFESATVADLARTVAELMADAPEDAGHGR